MGAAVAEGEQSNERGTPAAPVPSAGAGPAPFHLEGLLLLDAAGNDPVAIEAMTFADEGIGVIRAPGDEPRVLPWASVAAHVVERWNGGVIPEWWVDPELNRSVTAPGPMGTVTDPLAASRPLPHADPGAVIAVQTPFGTYRFLLPGGNPAVLSRRITDFAVRHHGLSGVPSVTTVAGTPGRGDRRVGSRAVEASSRWSRVQPYLVVALVLFIGVAVTLILLQSAGTIHLPYLGGSGPGSATAARTR
jgi:hypothetical protein